MHFSVRRYCQHPDPRRDGLEIDIPLQHSVLVLKEQIHNPLSELQASPLSASPRSAQRGPSSPALSWSTQQGSVSVRISAPKSSAQHFFSPQRDTFAEGEEITGEAHVAAAEAGVPPWAGSAPQPSERVEVELRTQSAASLREMSEPSADSITGGQQLTPWISLALLAGSLHWLERAMDTSMASSSPGLISMFCCSGRAMSFEAAQALPSPAQHPEPIIFQLVAFKPNLKLGCSIQNLFKQVS
ncbi:hypothetical protein BR93DRAFT_638573 [Coniochaeta sp. PMI_546]|nr:hypothetical protein BR93DRAFT_638573 [Coniochaeta sp. PMI_546]